MSRTHSTRNRAPDFTLHLDPEGWPDSAITNALLADIRREAEKQTQLLERMVRILECHNTTGIPHTLARIDRRLATHMPLKRGRKT